MDIESFEIVFATIGVVSLAVAIFVAIRSKSVGSGLIVLIYLLLSFVAISGAVGQLYLYNKYVPEHTRFLIGAGMSVIGWLVLSPFLSRYPSYTIKMGDIVPQGKTIWARYSQNIAFFLGAYCALTMFSDAFYDGNLFEAYIRNTVWWILMVCLLIPVYYSLEMRERGMLYRGKVILFSDIEHAEWENWPDKTRLKIRLKNKEQKLTIKTPRELNVPIDNYLRANFPRP